MIHGRDHARIVAERRETGSGATLLNVCRVLYREERQYAVCERFELGSIHLGPTGAGTLPVYDEREIRRRYFTRLRSLHESEPFRAEFRAVLYEYEGRICTLHAGHALPGPAVPRGWRACGRCSLSRSLAPA